MASTKVLSRVVEPGSPVLHAMTVVLTNGASIKLPTVMKRDRDKPLFPTLDIFNHNLWQHKIKTEAVLKAEQNYAPDFSQFYQQYGGGKGKRPTTGAPPPASGAALAAQPAAKGKKGSAK